MRKLFRAIKDKITGSGQVVSGLIGEYSSWEAAEAECRGYDSDQIFQKAISAAWAVKKGEAVYERDTFLFYEKAYNYRLAAHINKALADSKSGCKEVVDFGGSFGSTYWQNKDILPRDIRWVVVEQQHFYEYGKEHFEDGHLSFAYPIDKITSNTCVLCSAVLQYIRDYKNILDTLFEKEFEYIIIERTAVSDKEWICIQIERVIYDAEYPRYIFKEEELVGYFIAAGYVLIDSYSSMVDPAIQQINNRDVYSKCFVFKKSE